jgi:hypothetical protein
MYVVEAGLEPSWRMTRWGGWNVGACAWSSSMDLDRDVRISLRAAKRQRGLPVSRRDLSLTWQWHSRQ